MKRDKSMKKRRIAFSVIIVLSLFLGIAATAVTASAVTNETNSTGSVAAGRVFLSNYIQTFFDNSNGFPADEANDVIQTKDGYMWFATYNGLILYDGESFTSYNSTKGGGFNSSNVRALYEGKDSALWIATNDRGLVRYEKGVFTYYGKESGMSSGTVRAVTENSKGVIYCGTADGLYAVDANGENPDEYPVANVPLEGEDAPFVISVCSDSKDNIYAVLNNGTFYAVTPDGKTVKMNTDSLFYSVRCISGDRIIIGTQDTSVMLAEFNGGGFKSETVDLGMNNINTLYEDSAGRVWVGSDSGLGFFTNLSKDKEFTYINELPFNGFFSGICEDYENGYWVTSTAGGVVKLTFSSFTNENTLYGIPRLAVNAILKDGKFFYAATDNGLVIADTTFNTDKANGSGLIENELTALLKDARIRDIYKDSKGLIWFCTYGGKGVISYNPQNGEIKSLLTDDGLSTDRTRRITELKNDYYAVATANGADFIKDGKITTAQEAIGILPNEKLPENMVLCLYENIDDTLYLGTDGNGLYAVRDGKTIIYDDENGLSGNVILRVCGDPERNGVWVSAGAGMCFIDNDSREARCIGKLPAYSVFDILIEGDEIWLLTANSILKMNADDLLDDNVPVIPTEIGRSSGLTSSINANSRKYIDENKRLYICCDSGVNSISAETEKSQTIPNAAVRSVEVDGRVYLDFENEIVIPKNAERLTFDISFLSYGFSNGTTLHYLLEGQDRQEIVINPENGIPAEVSYTNLTGGNYKFMIYSAGKNGNIGNTVNISLRKELGFFEYVYVQIGLIILAVLLMGIVSLQIAKQKNKISLRKQAEYRNIITQSISAIANAIDAKDAYTKGHSARVAVYSAEIARRMGYNKDFVENIYYIGLLHDVGKIGIPSSIINKPERLTNEEYGIMKTHPKVGEEILKDITTIKNIKMGAAEHHERWDGGGYCKGLKGEEISIEGRIISAADSYDAMSSDRAYRKALPKDIIHSEFMRGSGSQFDPKIVEIVIDMIDKEAFNTVNINEIIDLDI